MPTAHHSSASATTHASTTALAEHLAASQSATIYVDLPDLDDAGAAAMLSADPPLHVEKDAVRDLWAVRAATQSEIDEAAVVEAAEVATTSSD
jgi:hypothetical protein